jgi:hypothetical protein
MASLKAKLLRKSISYHKLLGWLGGIALMTFVLSAMTHPLMVWTGPRAATFFPPQMSIESAQVNTIPALLERHGIDSANMVKLVPSQSGALLQVTQDNNQPRRYFDPQSGDEMTGQDEAQAVWLARYYTGLQDADVRDVVFQTEFDDAYPWVNRLLPVYKVTFDTEDNLTAFVYTELSAMANLTNDWKTFLQGMFGMLHTWDFLDDAEYARVAWMLLLLGSLIALSITGMAMQFFMKSRTIPSARRRWHRRLSWFVFIPLLMLSVSGMYHLLHYAYGESHRGLMLATNLELSPSLMSSSLILDDSLTEQKLNAVSLIQGPDNTLLYRFGLPVGQHGEHAHHQDRLKGIPTEKPSLYMNAATGQVAPMDDKAIALYQAEQLHGFDQALARDVQLVTRFGPNYDFRNKRLPVWQISYDTPKGDMVFMDPGTGILVDRLTNAERYESYSFSFLHKWNMLIPLIGMQARDWVVIGFLVIAFGFGVFGIAMLLGGQKRKVSQNLQSGPKTSSILNSTKRV